MVRKGRSHDVLTALVEETGAEHVYWNRRYDEADRQVDTEIKEALKADGITVTSFNGRLLTEPWEVKTGSGGYYKVFTPYWRKVREVYQPGETLPAPKSLDCKRCETLDIDDLDLHPTNPDWSEGLHESWTPGETGARERLTSFLDGPINNYIEDRNRPDIENGTSQLSPHLRFGEIGPRQIWSATKDAIESGRADEENAMVFLSEIVWREFSYVLLFHNPQLAQQNYNDDFQYMPWRSSKSDYEKWCHGQTGYPIVDAGMRQLWQTGWMHNRVRMIVASFLTKHLLLPWQQGEEWFWDTLVDADPASNAASWQWTAGSGADAAPYFRVFNPITQGQKFDETGDYVRKYCPELSQMPTKYIHAPWEADKKVLEDAAVVLGETYPKAMVDHSVGRQRALDAYDTLKAKRDAE